MPEPKLALIDGNSLVNRAFYALPPFAASDGTPTNAVYGFLSMLLKLLDEERPSHLAVAFDLSGPTFRDEIFSEYKAHRQAMPDALAVQVPLLKEVLAALGVAIVERPGYEADDVIGTLARRATEAGLATLIVTGDRDALQLVGPSVEVALTKKGISEVQRLGPDELAAEGLTPEQIIDLKALMGDASDNIPGVPGVGEKTAKKLLAEFGTVDEVLARAGEIPGALGRKLAEHADQARLSKRLATIDCEVPLETELTALLRRDPPAESLEVLRRLELRSIAERVARLVGRADAPAATASESRRLASDVATLADGAALRAWLEAWAPGQPVAALVAGAPDRPAGMALASLEAGPRACFLPARSLTEAGSALCELLADGDRPKVTHGLKSLAALARRLGSGLAGQLDDVELAAYLLDPARSKYRLEDLARDLLPSDPSWDSADELRRAPPEWEMPTVARFWGTQAQAALAVSRDQAPRLAEAGLSKLYREVELPLALVLGRMEEAGVLVDRDGLVAYGDELAGRIAELELEIFQVAGLRFNINSPRQLAEVLFERLALPVVKRTKTGPSTDADVLEQLSDLHPIASLLLDYRQLVKLKGTYVDGLLPLIRSDTGRLHTTFNQTVAATGRLSSQDPNLQNIPVRMAEGRRIRRVFVAPPGRLLVGADYSQIELRILADLSGDAGLADAFRRGEDIHAKTAAEMFGRRLGEVTAEERNRAKAINFGVVYGISDFGLARNTGITRAEARQFIDLYFERYPGVKRYMARMIEQARSQGFVTTILGRRRPIPDIHHRTPAVRQAAERTAINTPVQGSAADIIKLAMLGVDRRLGPYADRARMILQVHDELILEVEEALVDEVSAILKEEMEGAYQLGVPILAEVRAGPNWYDLK